MQVEMTAVTANEKRAVREGNFGKVLKIAESTAVISLSLMSRETICFIIYIVIY